MEIETSTVDLSKLPKFRYLEEGEIVQDGDEVEMSDSFKDPAKWVKAVGSVGQPAPNPNYPSHRKFRRPLGN